MSYLIHLRAAYRNRRGVVNDKTTDEAALREAIYALLSQALRAMWGYPRKTIPYQAGLPPKSENGAAERGIRTMG